MTHCRSLVENFRSDWMCGSATFTIVTSSTTMNCAIASTTRVLHGLLLIVVSLVSVAAYATYMYKVHLRCIGRNSRRNYCSAGGNSGVESSASALDQEVE